VAVDGELTLLRRIKLLPLDEEIIPEEDELYYQSIDIWGDADHRSLYMAIWRQHVDNSSLPGVSIRELLIYNLNEITEVSEIFRTVQGSGGSNCPDIEYPQFVATCYGRNSAKFNPSGTRLYLWDSHNDKQGQRWDGLVRLDIDRVNFETGGVPLNDWILSARELIWTGPGSQHGGVVPRPDYDPSQLPLEEEIAIWYDRDPGFKRDRIGAILRADQCAADYASYASDISQTPPDLWLGCLTDETFSAPANHGGETPGNPTKRY
jgi:hypothetical protein